MSLPQYDYVIIGAGPAGMAAAVEARQHGLNVLVLDEQPAVGGQIYRNIEDLEEQRPDEFQKLGADYQEAFELAQRFRA
ncbi:MAG: FAD-dependent oxidoreductase, partial [Deltaproteobacteria bacterium]